MACSLLLAGSLCSAQTGQPSSTKTTATKKTVHKKSRKRRVRGQQKIDAERIRKIQEALVREHYLSGQPSGKWDAPTQSALQKYQAANGWQSKVVPDSRALIKLGLGPDHDHLLNPESAMTSMPVKPPSATHAESPSPAGDDAAKKNQ